MTSTQNHPSTKIYRISQTMEMLGLSRSTINRFAKAGTLTKVQLGANSCGITEASILTLISGAKLGS